MKRLLFILLAVLLPCFSSAAQDDVLSRLREANFPSSLTADFTRTRHSPMLAEDLVSKGRVCFAQPDCLRWEVVSPSPKVTVFNSDSPRRFRLPSDRDFRVSTLEGKELSIILEPIRGDLKKLFARIIVKVDPATYIVRSVLLSTVDGDSTLIEFSNIRKDVDLPADCFVKQ